MQIIRDFERCPAAAQQSVLALGNFDGVHRGHQSILKHCVDFARTENRPAAAMTFEPHPREFFKRSAEPIRIYPFREKAELLKASGLDFLFVARFNARFAAMTADDFVGKVLCEQLKVRHVVTGYNFAFGKGRGGDTHALTEAAAARGFGFTACQAVEEEGKTVSSSAVREALAAGDVALASHMLGRPYAIGGFVRHGSQEGQKLGFPTANLSLTGLFKPRFGIYAARASIEGKKPVVAAVSLGIKPTFPGAEPLLEAHLFGVDESLYGRRLSVELVRYLREEKKFDSLQALRDQIEADCKQVKKMLAV